MNEVEKEILYNEHIIPSALEVAKNYDFTPQFNKKMLKKIDKWDDKISDEERNRRVDLTNLMFITIDCESTMDFDDAIYVEKATHGIYNVYVSIADVAHFVQEGSLLDKDALKRGNSLYLIDTVLPMLPRKLSNDLCSLNPQKERLAMTFEMQVNKNGTVVKSKIYESIIKSRTRTTYENINAWLEGKTELKVHESIDDNGERWQIEQMLRDCVVLQKTLEKKRKKRGNLDFNFQEVYIDLDETHKPIGIKAREVGTANKIIEELMILTNEVVGEKFYSMEIPYLYRIHEQPNDEALEEVYNFIRNFDYEIPRTTSSKDIAKVLEQAKETPEEDVINLLLLRAMKKAVYSHEELGHFGLGCKYYSHTTSPIRRYSDLFTHRIIKDWLHGTLTSSKIKHYKEIAPMVGTICSRQERKALEAEQEYDEIKRIEMAYDNFIGDTFIGKVIGVKEGSLKIKLDNTITGVISLKDEGLFEETLPHVEIEEVETGKKFRIGDHIKVRMVQVYLVERVVVFELVKEEE